MLAFIPYIAFMALTIIWMVSCFRDGKRHLDYGKTGYAFACVLLGVLPLAVAIAVSINTIATMRGAA